MSFCEEGRRQDKMMSRERLEQLFQSVPKSLFLCCFYLLTVWQSNRFLYAIFIHIQLWLNSSPLSFPLFLIFLIPFLLKASIPSILPSNFLLPVLLLTLLYSLKPHPTFQWDPLFVSWSPHTLHISTLYKTKRLASAYERKKMRCFSEPGFSQYFPGLSMFL